MPITGPWRRTGESDSWHFCTNCPFYPDKPGADSSYERPTSGWVCDICRQLQAKNDCG